MLSQIAFALMLAAAGYLIFKRYQIVSSAIKLGRQADYTDQPNKRLGIMLRVAFGQKKMFDRPVVGLMHFVIYIGFILINIELLEIILDGLTGHHRLFAPILGVLYPFLINGFEILAAGVLLVCVAFLIRRNVMYIQRFRSKDLDGWPRTDANLILVWEIALMSLFLKMNAVDSLLQSMDSHYPQVGSFVVSGLMVPFFKGFSPETLQLMERSFWWLHIAGILGFAAYLSWSKHLHVLLAFPNTYFSRLPKAGHIDNMPVVMNEVKAMMDPSFQVPAPTADTPAKFGAKDINDLTWKNLMDAYSCTECGRCTSACPANMTGKLLSPRSIMQKTRDRAEEVSLSLSKGGPGLEDGKSLIHDYITQEELMACTTCNACVDACPINISPLEIIVELRRYVALEESGTPASWNSMFAALENNGAPWAFPASARTEWTQKTAN